MKGGIGHGLMPPFWVKEVSLDKTTKMLRVTASDINGKSYDKELVSADKLAEMFGIKVPSKKMEFHLGNALTHTDRFGQNRRAEGLTVKPRIASEYKGSFVVIEYFERRVEPNANGTEKSLLPRSISVTNSSRKGNISDDGRGREKAVLLALRPDCETSPLYKKGSLSRFKLHNPEVVAEAVMETNKAKFRAWKRIHDGDIGATQLAIIAAGMGIKTNGRTFTEIKADLENKAAFNPSNFEAKSDDRATLSLGLIKRCRDLNVISFVSRSGKSYLTIDEQLSEATGNMGMNILSGGYASPNEAQSALVNVLVRQDEPFIALREMLELAEASNIQGKADQITLDEERTSTANLFGKKVEEEPFVPSFKDNPDGNPDSPLTGGMGMGTDATESGTPYDDGGDPESPTEEPVPFKED